MKAFILDSSNIKKLFYIETSVIVRDWGLLFCIGSCLTLPPRMELADNYRETESNSIICHIRVAI